ncbi:hypothetical protein NQ317_015058 [Molorchus minor]|uniref:Serpin domain-containing protein n=1 Tax=Molorchus minor TaxID=1323400 RepID=A0ABQ9K4Z4_9CUCU|nr:hypothetical protein NQ317_015058 [Molorchus minor]
MCQLDCSIFARQDNTTLTLPTFDYLNIKNVSFFSPLSSYNGVLVSSDLIMAEENEALTAVLQGNGEFTKNLYKVLAREKGNVFFSPISVHAILSLAAQGSASQTKEAFTKVLNVADVKVAADGYKDIMMRLNSIKDVTLLMAYKVFLMEKYELREEFKSLTTQQFLAEAQSLDFAKSEAAAETINTWVEQKTNNKIKDLINGGDLTQDTRLVLVNAIYFKGRWAEPFRPRSTKIEDFYLNGKRKIKVEMMHINREFFFKNDESLDAKVLELPYVNNTISLIVILPNKRNGIDDLEEKLAGTDLMNITDNMYKEDVYVSLPKFKIEQTIDLQQSLTELGLGDMFTDNANFSKMIGGSENLYVSKVVQKVFIEVNEEGAEAAAAAGMGYMEYCMPPPPKPFLADHPFMIILQAKQLNKHNILFSGRISSPKPENTKPTVTERKSKGVKSFFSCACVK